ncbi:uncharacterized protein LOC106056443 [Biomphalaria glabrata]|uniref:Uncharacterized protein LOC106056443 n=1 Tax=Biomphalaria glabrata TaxID=6526 RepID=A0A9W3AR28_BIOGL|nr:uncharacterized protein LOC106056443 [Biomphalaria glabrata]XP_055889683.1 uncharacterized protein LOC106056443 [Biomphalaria glabrata]XP_055889684.1 uncharacterized protein LOC106056443 [Biomphalaria glabrata]
MDFVYTTATSTGTKEEKDALYMPLIVSLTVSVVVIALMAICLTVLATRGRRSNCKHSPRDYNDLHSDRVDFHKYLTCKERDAVNNIQSTMTRTSSSLYNVPQEMCQYSEICTNRVISSCYIDPIYDVKIDMHDQT